MEIINLDNIKVNEFYLGNIKYKYQFRNEDKIYYNESLLDLNPKKDNTKMLIKIFTSILEKQNLKVNVTEKDVKGLFDFFNYTLL